MELPWKKYSNLKEKKEKLEKKVQELEKEKEKYQAQLESEKERRSELSRKKQEAEEQLNRLKDKLENQENTEKDTEEVNETDWERPELQEVKKIIGKLSTVESPEKDLVTLYTPGKIKNLPDLKGLKNTLNSEDYSRLSTEKSFIAFMDGEIFSTVLKTRPFFKSSWKLCRGFQVEEITDFIESEKYWALVTTGETKIFVEEDGEFEEVERVKTRVENQQKKGGFSQGRFERKRDEQLEAHIDKTEELLEEFEEVKLLGNKKLCKDLPGEYLGGFDSSRSPGPKLFYDFRLKRYS